MNGIWGSIAAAVVFVVGVAASSPLRAAHGTSSSTVRVPAILAVRKDLGAPPTGVADLKFHDIFKTPVGDKGLEPSAALLALDGKRVRMIGYMVHQQPEPKGTFLLSPLPAEISDEDEPLADDLPPSVVTVEIAGAANRPIPLLPGLVRISGVLHVGATTDAASGRVSAVRIALDALVAKALLGARSAPAKPARTAAR
jgi:hypothetical protein